MTDTNTRLGTFLENHAAWFATTADHTLPGTAPAGVSAYLQKDHGHLTVAAGQPVPIEEIDRALTWIRMQSARRLLIWSERENRELDIVLSSRGCTAGFCPRWMLRDLDRPLPVLAAPGSIRISRASLDDLPALHEVAAIPYVDLDLAGKILQPRHHESVWMLIARDGDAGPIVGHLTLFIPHDKTGWGGVYGAGVHPDRQRQGIGSALTLEACRIAAETGATHLSLNATPDGERAYRKVGFEVIGDGQTWFAELREDDAAPDPDTIAWAERLARGTPDALDAARATSPTMPNGESPFAFAARFGSADAATWLIEHGATPEIPALARLQLRSDLETALRDPGLVNARLGPHGRTPLHLAVLADDRELTSRLLAAGADTSIRDDEFGGTPLDWAKHLGRTPLAQAITTATNT